MEKIKDQKVIVVKVNLKPDDAIEFIQQIEKEIDDAIGKLGFARSTTTKADDYAELIYYQFGVAL